MADIAVLWYVINVALSSLASFASIVLAIYAARHRNVKDAPVFAVMALATAWICALYAIQTITIDLNLFVTFSKIEYIGLVVLPVAWLVLALNRSRLSHRVNTRLIMLLSIIPAITLMLTLTNELHGLVWARPQLIFNQVGKTYHPDYGAWFWIGSGYAYVLFIVGAFRLIRQALKSWQHERRQAIALFFIALLPIIGSIMAIFDFDTPLMIQPFPLSLAIAAVILFWAVFRYELFNVLPLAYSTVFDTLPYGIVVLNRRDEVIASNTAIHQFMGLHSPVDPSGHVSALIKRLQDDYPFMSRDIASVEDIQINNHYYDIQINPFGDRNNEHHGRVVLFHNVSERYQAEQVQKQNQRFLHALQESTAIINRSLNPDEIMSLILITVGSVVPHDLANIMMLEPDGKEARIKYAQGYDLEHERQLRERVYDTSVIGTYRTVRDTLRPLTIADTRNDPNWVENTDVRPILSFACAPIIIEGDLIGFLNLDSHTANQFTPDDGERLQVFADQAATALKNARLYQQVSSLERTKTDMIRIASHDLRNPLGVIIGFTELLLGDEDNYTEQQLFYLRAIRENADRMVQITKDILSLERIKEMVANQAPETVDLQQQVESAAKEYRPRMKERQQRFSLIIPEGDYRIQGDPGMIYEAVVNLLNNAIKYTPDGGEIEVLLTRSGNKVRYVVRDSGYGVPDELKPNLFQPFMRANTTETSKIEGTGLGLSLVKTIVDRYNGHIIFESERGKGSTFGFEFPSLNQVGNLFD